MLHDIIGDVRTSLRQLGRAPGFTAAAIAVLALGIALNAAVFGVFHALVFAGRPLADPDRLVQIYSRHPQEVESYRAFSHGAFEVLAARRDVFTGVTAHALGTVGVRETAGGDARRTFAGVRVDRLLRRARRAGRAGAPVHRRRRATRRRGHGRHRDPRLLAAHRTAGRSRRLDRVRERAAGDHRRDHAAGLHRHHDGHRAGTAHAAWRLRCAAHRVVRGRPAGPGLPGYVPAVPRGAPRARRGRGRRLHASCAGGCRAGRGVSAGIAAVPCRSRRCHASAPARARWTSAC